MSTHPHLRTADDACLIALEDQVDDETIEALQGRIATALAGGPPHARRTIGLCVIEGVELSTDRPPDDSESFPQ